jgi:hypothetical protein
MTPFGESHRYQEQIGAFLLGKLDAGELKAMQAHLDRCPACQAEVRELEPVVAGLADAVPDRIDEVTRPPGDLEESTLAPILREIQRARSRKQQFQWSALAAAAICVVVLGLAAFTWLLEPEVLPTEQLSFSDKARGVDVHGDLIAHDWGTEIQLVVSGLRAGQKYIVTLISEAGDEVNFGTIIGTGDKQLECTFDTEKLLREDATKLEVHTPGGELAFLAKLPEEPSVPDRDSPALDSSPLDGIPPRANSDRQNESSEACGPESKEEPGAEGNPPADTQEKPKADGPGGGTPPKKSPPESDGEKSPPKKSPPESDGEKSPPGDQKPGIAPEESVPPDDQTPYVPPDPCELPPDERPPTCPQYDPHTGSG